MQQQLNEKIVSDAKPRSNKGLIVLLVIVAAAVGGYYAWRHFRSTDATAAQATPQNGANRNNRNNRNAGGGGVLAVVVASTQQQDLPIYLDGLGSATAFNTVTVKSRIDGQLEEVHFVEGQDVKKGDLLATIDPRPYQVALSQAQANFQRDSSQLADARRIYERDKQLVAQGVIPQQQFDTQGASVGQVEGVVQADQAQVDNAKLNLSYCSITAPISGRVGLRLVDGGNMVHASDQSGLLVITQVQPIAVTFSLPEDNLPDVVTRMRVASPLSVRAMSRDGATQLATGNLLTIDNQIDQTTGTFRLKAVFDNANRTLWPNQFVNARLLLETKKNTTVIPAAAIQTGTQGTFVYLVKDDNTVEIRPVKVSNTQGGIVSIASGLTKGDRVVTDGQDRLQAGMRVNPQSDARGSDAAPKSDVTRQRSSQPTGAADGQSPQTQGAQAGERRSRQNGGERKGDGQGYQVAGRGGQ
jgi:multidrug efflux system membrane fusion protein